MAVLFFKLVLFALFIVAAGLASRRLLSVLGLKLNRRRRMKLANPLVREGIYGDRTVSHAVYNFIPVKYQDVHPGRQVPVKGKFKLKVKDLFAAVDYFLDNPVTCKNLLILADPGMGKSTLCINYFCHNQGRGKEARHTLFLVPLNRDDADSLIMECPLKENRVLVLDGLDEDPKAFGDPHQRLLHLAGLGRAYNRMMITCGLDFIPKTRRLKSHRGYVSVVPKKGDDLRPARFRRFFLSPLQSRDLAAVAMASRSFWKTKKEKEIINFLHSGAPACITPFTAGYLDNIWSDDIPGLTKKADIFHFILQRQMGREFAWKDKPVLERFLCLLARDLFLERTLRGEEAMPPDALDLKAREWRIPVAPFRNGPPFLVSYGRGGKLMFSHRAFLEFLFIRQLMTRDRSCSHVPLTGLMKTFFFETMGNLHGPDLATEFQWLGQYNLKVAGIREKSPEGDRLTRAGLFRHMLQNTTRHAFLARLAPLFDNPIFYEFGWNRELYLNLRRAVLGAKTSLMRLEKPKWTVMINPGHIEIQKRHQKAEKILISEANYREYERLRKDEHMIRLNRAIGLNGLRMLNRINQSKQFCALPDPDSPRTFTLFFLEMP